MATGWEILGIEPPQTRNGQAIAEPVETIPQTVARAFEPTRRRLIEPGREAMRAFIETPSLRTLLGIPLAGIRQAGAIVGGPVESATKGLGLRQPVAEAVGDIAEIAAPLGAAKLAMAGKLSLPIGSATRTAAETIGITTTPPRTAAQILAERKGRGALQKMGLEGAEEVVPDPLKTATQALEVEQGITKTLPENMQGLRLSTETTRKVFDAVEGFFKQSGVAIDPDIPITYQAAKAIAENPQAFGSFKEALSASGRTLDDFAETLLATESSAGRQLQQASHLRQVLSSVAKESPELAELTGALERASPPLSGWDVVGHFSNRFVNLWRGSLVTQWATAIRNFSTQAARIGLDSVEGLLDVAVNNMFRLGTTEERALGPALGRSMEAFSGLVSRGKQADAKRILAAFPEQSERLFSHFSSDVAVSTALRSGQMGKIASGIENAFDKAEKGINFFNFLNRGQEFLIRRSVFRAGLADDLAKMGQDVTQLAPKDIPVDLISKHVDKALEVTFATSPKNGPLKWFTDLYSNPFGKLLSFVMPFPRFMTNAWKFQFEYSPAGFLKLLSGAERAKVAAGDPRALSKALLGSGMLYSAWEIRNNPELAGEKWYEIKSDNRRIDMRPFAPFTSYLFIAELARRVESGANLPEMKDLFQGIMASQFRAGAGLYVLDGVQEALTSVLATNLTALEKTSRGARRFAGEVASGFLQPLQTFRQLFAEYGQFASQSAAEELKLREVREEPFLGPVKAKLPIVSQGLPEKEEPLRAETRKIESADIGGVPVSRQLSGITIRSKNPVEAEAARLGLTAAEIYPKTGEPKADRLILKHMGPMTEKAFGKLVKIARYQLLSDEQKRVVWTELLPQIRERAKLSAGAEDPVLFRSILLRQRLRPRVRELLEAQGKSLK